MSETTNPFSPNTPVKFNQKGLDTFKIKGLDLENSWFIVMQTDADNIILNFFGKMVAFESFYFEQFKG